MEYKVRVLITGHKGFVGRYFWKHYKDNGYDVTGIDVNNGENSIDARDFFRKSDTPYDVVIHLAAVVGGREVIDREPLKVAVDLSIDSEMFQWALRTKPRHLVYYSSSAAYPIAIQDGEPEFPLVESDINLDYIASPDMTYGFAKLAGEYQAKFLQAEGIRTHVFRPFSGYGEDQDLCYPFPSFINRGVSLEDPFYIWGDGNQCRDFIHIDDIVGATLEALYEDVEGPINLGTGLATSFLDLAELTTNAVRSYTWHKKYSPEFVTLLDKPVGVRYRVANADKMLSFYTPKVTLEEGIARAVRKQWHN